MTTERLPRGWVWSTIGEVGDVKLGRQRSPAHHNGPHMRPYLRVANVLEDRIDVSDILEMNFSPEEFEIYRLAPEDILLNEGQSLELVGRAAMFRGELTDGCFQNTLIRWRASSAVEPKFALFLFRSYLHAGVFRKIARWTINLAHLGAGRFAQLPFPLPPIREQRRMISQVEKHFTQLDAAESSLKRAKARIARYRASVLNAACEGRLVPTEAALARAKGWAYEPADRQLQLQGPLVVPEARPREQESRNADHDQRAMLPTGWTWKILGDVGESTTGTTPRRDEAGNYGGALPFFKPTDLNAGYNVRLARQYLSERGALTARVLPAGSVLVTCIGATIGKTGLARVPCATNQQINAVTPTNALCSSEWVFWVLTSPLGQRAIKANASATTLPILNKTRFELLPIPIPPRQEQDRIVSDIERRLSIADEIGAAIAAAGARASSLRQAILKRAFEGKLVPQDPRDEPASSLLERIREEREAAASAGAKGSKAGRGGRTRGRRAARS